MFLELNNFNITKKNKDGLDNRCKSCKTEQRLLFMQNNPDARARQDRNQARFRAKRPNYTVEWNQLNHAKKLQSAREYRMRNPGIETRRYQTESLFRLKMLLRTRLNVAIRRNYKSGSAVSDLGMPIAAFLVYLNLDAIDKYGIPYTGNESKFHIDHIIPLSAFDISDRKQLLIAVNWSNLQVLTAKENLSKGVKRR